MKELIKYLIYAIFILILLKIAIEIIKGIYHTIFDENDPQENFKSIDYTKNYGKFGDPISTTYRYKTLEEQFPEIIAYDNDYKSLRMGLDKCAEECIPNGGQCVEFGLTGNAWCFPKVEKQEKNYKTDLDDQYQTRLSYPNN